MSAAGGEDLLAQLDAARDALCALVRAEDAAVLARRPAPGDWSVVENVRHLIYAEQLHLGRRLIADFAYSGVGLHTDGRPHRSGVGTEPTDDIAVVVAAWDAAHARVREAARHPRDPGFDVDAALRRNLGHLGSHTRTVERLLGRGPAPRARPARRSSAQRDREGT